MWDVKINLLRYRKLFVKFSITSLLIIVVLVYRYAEKSRDRQISVERITIRKNCITSYWPYQNRMLAKLFYVFGHDIPRKGNFPLEHSLSFTWDHSHFVCLHFAENILLILVPMYRRGHLFISVQKVQHWWNLL